MMVERGTPKTAQPSHPSRDPAARQQLRDGSAASPFDARDELVRLLSTEEQDRRYSDCDWTWRNYRGCVRLPFFRLATPHGHMDFCPEHISAAIAMLPPDWVEFWAFREPPEREESDDIPF